MKKHYILVLALLSIASSFAQTAFYPSFDASGQYFGSVVAISGNDIVVTSTTSIMLNTDRGKVYVFNADGTTISQTAVLYPNFITPLDGYGNAIAIDGEFLAVGATLDDELVTNGGAIHIFRKVDGNWNYFQKINTPEATTDFFFGSTIKIHGNQMLVTASGSELPGEDSNTNRGTVFTLKFDGTEWLNDQRIEHLGVLNFGKKIYIDNNVAIISSENSNHHMSFNRYVFDNTNWQFVSTSPVMENTNTRISDFNFVNGHIYAIAQNSNSSKVQQVDYDLQNWNTTDLFAISQFDDHSADAIAVSGNNIFIGSGNYMLQTERKFPLLHFKNMNNDWIYQQKIYGTGPAQKDDSFGFTLAASGNQVVAGALREGDLLPYGKAYLINAETMNTTSFDRNSVALYPNPTNDKLYIHNNGAYQIVKSEIYSITGKLLSTVENVQQLSLENFANGLYLAKLYTNNGASQTYKIIKK